MAVPMIKTTYSLDADSIRSLERIAKTWGVSRSEALRRAIRAVAELPVDDERVRALDELQASVGLDARGAKAWTKRVKEERSASSARRSSGR